jgi:hypothetical protein
MGLFRDGFPVQRSFDGMTFLGIAGLVALLLAGVSARSRAPLLGLGIFWFFIWHSMESTLLPLELVFEHRNYLALFGPALILATAVTRLYSRTKLQRPTVAAVATLVLLLALNTASRAFTWGDADRLAASEYRRHPESPRAIQYLMSRADAHGNRDAMATLLAQIQHVAADNAWPYLLELRTRCKGGTSTTDLTLRLRDKLATALARPADVEQLSFLSGSVYAGECPAVSTQLLLELAEALAANRRAHSKTTRIGALNLYARIAAAESDFPTARDALGQSFALAGASSPGLILASVMAAADAASHHTTYDDAIHFIKDVTKGQEQSIFANDIVLRLKLKEPTESGIHK